MLLLGLAINIQSLNVSHQEAESLHLFALVLAVLIAACLGSTDAGATINVLSSVRHLVPERLKYLLEFESSVNDPTALLLFGLIAGALFGYVAKFVINGLAHVKSQLLIVAMSIAFGDYGCSHFLGGSGLISVYITGVMMTNMIYRQADINHESI